MRFFLPMLLLSLSCRAPASPDVPKDSDVVSTDTEPETYTPLDDTAETGSAPDSDSDADTGVPGPPCDALLAACLQEGEHPNVCQALYDGCLTSTLPDECQLEFYECVDAGTPLRQCAVELLICIADPLSETDTLEDTDTCADQREDCLVSGRLPAECDLAFEDCLLRPDSAPPQDTVDSDTAPADSDTAEPCTALQTDCLALGLPPTVCDLFADQCADADAPDGDGCLGDYGDCLSAGTDPATCLSTLLDCVAPSDTGLTCRDLLATCTLSGGDPVTCTNAYQVCIGMDPDPLFTCDLAWQACLNAGITPATCDAERQECLGVIDTAPIPVDCDVERTDCLNAGRDPATCETNWQICLAAQP
jgi:hypothetical protein